MNTQERVLATLNRQPVDQVPVDIWLTPEVLGTLRAHTGVEDELEVYRKLDVDKIVWIFPGYESEKFDPNESDGRDPWGVSMKRTQSGKATYMEYQSAPLGEMEEPEELADYPLWPDPQKFNYEAAAASARRAREFGFATIGPWISMFEVYCHMRGMENALMDTIAEPEFIEATLDRIEAIQTEMLGRFLTEMGDLIDIVFISDDLGTQESQLLSVEAWQRHLQPRLTRWCDLIHTHNKKVLFHTDGAARPFIPHLIESGIDILNPIQHICPGIGRSDLKKDFGEQIIFHGGVENQHVLPYGTPDDVREETRECLRTLGAGGGYIPSSCHNIQAGTPVKNILAMIEAVRSS